MYQTRLLNTPEIRTPSIQDSINMTAYLVLAIVFITLASSPGPHFSMTHEGRRVNFFCTGEDSCNSQITKEGIKSTLLIYSCSFEPICTTYCVLV